MNKILTPLTEEYSIICSGEPNLWRTVITLYRNNSQKQAIEMKNQIITALKLKEKVEGMITYLKAEIERSEVESYKHVCRQELVIYESINKDAQRSRS